MTWWRFCGAGVQYVERVRIADRLFGTFVGEHGSTILAKVLTGPSGAAGDVEGFVFAVDQRLSPVQSNEVRPMTLTEEELTQSYNGKALPWYGRTLFDLGPTKSSGTRKPQ